MNDQNLEKKASAKQGYVKPTLRAIELVTDQVLGVGCKMASVAGPNSGEFSYGTCLAPSPCSADAS